MVNSEEDRQSIYDFMPLLTDPEPEEIEPLTDQERMDILIESQKRSQILNIK